MGRINVNGQVLINDDVNTTSTGLYFDDTDGYAKLNPYVMNKVLAEASTIDAGASSPYALSEIPSNIFRHTPTGNMTYVLPYISNTTTILHEIIISVKFTSTSYSIVFEMYTDSNNSTTQVLTPLSEVTLEPNCVICYVCRYEALLSSWVVMPIKFGT